MENYNRLKNPKLQEEKTYRDVERLTLTDWVEIERFVRDNRQCKVTISRNDSGIHIETKKYKHYYSKKYLEQRGKHRKSD